MCFPKLMSRSAAVEVVWKVSCNFEEYPLQFDKCAKGSPISTQSSRVLLGVKLKGKHPHSQELGSWEQEG